VKLFEPIQISTLTLPNRTAVTAMVTRLSGEDGFVNQAIIDRYESFARGGAGLIVVEATSIHGGKSGPLLRASSDEFVLGLASIADACHAVSESRVFLQIIHFLKIARSGWRQKITDLSTEEVERLPAMFADAAARTKRAGFDGVELHMAHAYTMSSFLSRRNRRQDRFGGSLENRMRLPSMVIQAVRDAVGEAYPVGIRFDAEECIKNGYSLPDSKQFALRFAELGVCYVSLSAGGKFEDAIHKPGDPLYPYTGYSGDRCMPGTGYENGFNLYLAEGIRSALRAHGFDTPVIGSGKIPPELAEQVLAEERCDIVGMARPFLADPWWPSRIQQGKADEIVRCTYCNVCKNLDENFKKVACYLWPKGAEHAPAPGERPAPAMTWTTDPALRAEIVRGRVRLRWDAPAGGPATGYDVFRSTNGMDFERFLATVRTHTVDKMAVSGRRLSYYVQAYDAGGQRSLPTNIVEAELPAWNAG